MMLSTPPIDPSGRSIPTEDAPVAGVDDHVAGDQVMASVFDSDARSVLGRVVAGGPVRLPRKTGDAFTVSNRTNLHLIAVAPPRHPRSGPRDWSVQEQVPLDHVVVEEPWTWMPGPGLSLIELSAILKWSEPNNPIPSPSGGMLWLNEPPRTTLRDERLIAAPKKTFFDEEMSTTRLWRAPASSHAEPNSTAVPPFVSHPVVAVVQDADVAE